MYREYDSRSSRNKIALDMPLKLISQSIFSLFSQTYNEEIKQILTPILFDIWYS